MLGGYPVEDIVTDPLPGLQYGTLFSRKTYHGRNHTEAATSIHGKVLQHDCVHGLNRIVRISKIV